MIGDNDKRGAHQLWGKFFCLAYWPHGLVLYNKKLDEVEYVDVECVCALGVSRGNLVVITYKHQSGKVTAPESYAYLYSKGPTNTEHKMTCLISCKLWHSPVVRKFPYVFGGDYLALRAPPKGRKTKEIIRVYQLDNLFTDKAHAIVECVQDNMEPGSELAECKHAFHAVGGNIIQVRTSFPSDHKYDINVYAHPGFTGYTSNNWYLAQWLKMERSTVLSIFLVLKKFHLPLDLIKVMLWSLLPGTTWALPYTNEIKVRIK